MWSKRDLLFHPNITNDVIIYKSSLYATSWTFWKNNFDFLWHYIGYITKSTPYKIKILSVIIYFYSFPACYLKIYLHWVFNTFNYLSNKVNLKLLSFVVRLQQLVKHITPQLQPYHLNLSFLPYIRIKAVIILSYHRECSSFLYTLLKYYKYKYLKFYFTFQKIFSASNVRNNTQLLKRNPSLSYFLCEILTRRSCFYNYDFYLHRFRHFVLCGILSHWCSIISVTFILDTLISNH